MVLPEPRGAEPCALSPHVSEALLLGGAPLLLDSSALRQALATYQGESWRASARCPLPVLLGSGETGATRQGADRATPRMGLLPAWGNAETAPGTGPPRAHEQGPAPCVTSAAGAPRWHACESWGEAGGRGGSEAECHESRSFCGLGFLTSQNRVSAESEGSRGVGWGGAVPVLRPTSQQAFGEQTDAL